MKNFSFLRCSEGVGFFRAVVIYILVLIHDAFELTGNAAKTTREFIVKRQRVVEG